MTPKPDLSHELDAAVLGQLMTAESMLHMLPDDQHVADFTMAALAKVPGMSCRGMCIAGVPYGLKGRAAGLCAQCGARQGDCRELDLECRLRDWDACRVVRLGTSSRAMGFVVLEANDPRQFTLYEPFVRNFINSTAVKLEQSRQTEELRAANLALSRHRDQLEETVRRRTEDLRQSEERYRQIVETANEGIFAVDQEFRIAFANPTLAEMLGYTPQEMMGLSVDEFLFPRDLPWHGQNRARRRRGHDECYEQRIRTRDGGELWAIVSAKALAGPSGEFAGAFAMLTDITERRRAEKALRVSEEKFRKTFDHSPLLCTVSLLEDGTYLEVNEAFCRISGFSREEAVGRTSVELGWIDQKQRAILAADMREHGRVVGRQIDLTAKSGQTVTCAYYGEVFTLDGRPHLISIADDVTESLAKDLEYGQIINTAIDGFWVVNTEGRILEANPAGAGMLGYSIGELVTMHVWDVEANESPADTRGRVEEIMREGSARFETMHRRKDGSMLDVEVSVSYVPLGEPRFVCFVRDISARKQADKALREAQERFRLAFHTSPDAININRLSDGRYTEVNQGFLDIMGYTREEVVGKGSMDLDIWVNPEDRAELVRGLQENGFYANLEALFRRKDGSVTTGLMSASVIQMEDEPHIISITRDIGHMREAEKERAHLKEQLQQAQKMEALGTLAGGIAHDFNNILGAIIGYAELALQAAEEGETAPEETGQALRAAERAKQLVKNILAFSRKEAFDPKPLSINRVVAEAVHIIERTIPKMIAVEARLGSDLKRVHADPTQLEQILLNLASNAKDAMPQGGRLLLETSAVTIAQAAGDQRLAMPPGEYVVISVSDTGMGMEPKNLQHAFEPFFTTKDIGKGTGLGLSSVYGIVRSHEGHITCSTEPGQGTTFRIHLPALQGPSQAIPDHAAASEDLPGGSETILVADDEQALRNIAARFLRSKGYRVLTAASGEEAVDTYRHEGEALDLIILDLGMPGMGGKRALEEILAMDPEAKVLIASGYAVDANASEILAAGAAGYVAKPYSQGDLLRKIREVVES